MTNLSSILLVALLFIGAYANRLVYVEKPNGPTSAEFVGKLTKTFDVRGDFGNFALMVDDGTQDDSKVVYAEYDTEKSAYFVVENVDLDFFPDLTESHIAIFENYRNVRVQDKYVFEVAKDSEDAFVRSIPPYLEVVMVPTMAISAPATEFNFVAPPNPDPKIVNLIALVDATEIKNFVTYLTGETSTLITRQAQSTGAGIAASWLSQQFTSFGFSSKTQDFRSGYSPNVVATLTGKLYPTKYVLVTAHYDDRAASVSSPTDRAPGANDNGSGTGALLEIAKRIYTSKVTFAYSVILIAFSGEEQGLYGSAYAAQQFKAQGTSIVAVLNADMIAYRSPSEVPQLAFVTRSSTLSLNTVLNNISSLYVPSLTLGTTTSCCTDHSSFYNQGYAATSFFERNGAIADPQYHKVGDLVNRVGYDVDNQYPAIVKAVYASLLTIAEYQ